MYKRIEDQINEIMAEQNCSKDEALRIICAGNPETRKMIEKLLEGK